MRYTPRSLAARPWKMMGLEDEISFSALQICRGKLLNFQGVSSSIRGSLKRTVYSPVGPGFLNHQQYQPIRSLPKELRTLLRVVVDHFEALVVRLSRLIWGNISKTSVQFRRKAMAWNRNVLANHQINWRPRSILPWALWLILERSCSHPFVALKHFS